jgi:protein O-mannosyl-transferase
MRAGRQIERPNPTMKPAELKRKQPTMKTKPPTGQVAGVCVFLVLAVLVVFGQTAHFNFVNYDDEENVYLNPVVAKGLSAKAIGWAFTHAQASNWIPLTTLSHMLDCQLFGLHAGGHHVVNVLWHAGNAVLLFLVLRQMTGSFWRSAFVAAVFAVHPLRAESVAWVSERKDVMSGFFFILTIGAYVRYARQPSGVGYGAVILLFALGLLAKPMLATLPFVLLLLDYWPLARWRDWRQFGRLVGEKIPLFALSAASCVAAALVPGLLITDSHRLSLLERIANALVAYVVYLRQMIYPAGLAALYPIVPSGQPLWRVSLAFVLLAAISAGVVAWRKQRPWLLMGWLWYLGMLFPVIGIVQISNAAAQADRYTYLPEIGLAIAGTWAIADWSARWENRQLVLGGLMGAVIGLLMVCGQRQTSFWRSGESLWTRALACTSGNSLAHLYLGAALAREGQSELAIEHYRTALAIAPDNLAALNNLGTALAQEGSAPGSKGKVEEAMACFRKALQIDPASKVSHYNLAVALSSKGETEEAIAEYRKTLAIDPNLIEAHLNLGNALRKSGHVDEAIAQYQKAVEISPDHAAARGKLAVALLGKGEMEEAIAQFRKALEINPDQADVQNNLAWLLATTAQASLRDGARAVALASLANQSSGGGNPIILRTLAAAYAETGRYGDATATARRALELAKAQKNGDLAAKLPKEIKLYEADMPMRDSPP